MQLKLEEDRSLQEDMSVTDEPTQLCTFTIEACLW